MAKKTIRRTSPRARRLTEIPGEATRRRLMDAAEELFAERGFEGVSLREVVLKAGANVASAHYHFGSKEELIRQVFARCAAPVLAQTDEMLKAAEEHVEDSDYLERVIAAVITPSIRGRSDVDDRVRKFNRLRGHLFMESREFAITILTSAFYTEPASRVLQAFQNALPLISPNELAWKLHVLLGTLGSTTTTVGRIHPVLSGSYQPDDPDEALNYLVPLMATMMRAQLPAPGGDPPQISKED